MSNLMELTDKGQIAPLRIGPDLEYWSELFTHLLEEYNSRGGVPKETIKNIPIVNATFPDKPKAVEALAHCPLPPLGSALFKFTKKSYAFDLVDKGRIKISPASSYRDPSLNSAICDDELSITTYYPRDEITISVPQKNGHPELRTKPLSDIKRSCSSAVDYYVYCLSNSIDLRLFDDFEVDACVIIRNKLQFLRILQHKLDTHLRGWTFAHGPIQYFDPYHVGLKEHINPYMYKHFRYWYQKEYRCIWLPPDNPPTLKPLFIELGSLASLAECITF